MLHVRGRGVPGRPLRRGEHERRPALHRPRGTRCEPLTSTQMAVNSISFGSPHVRCTPMGVHRTCGEPNEIKCGEPNEIKKNTHPKNITALFGDQDASFGGGRFVACAQMDHDQCATLGGQSCAWSPWRNLCQDVTCADMADERSCAASWLGCEFDAGTSVCTRRGGPAPTRPCISYSGAELAACPEDRCTQRVPFNSTPTAVNSLSFGSPRVRCAPMWALSHYVW